MCLSLYANTHAYAAYLIQGLVTAPVCMPASMAVHGMQSSAVLIQLLVLVLLMHDSSACNMCMSSSFRNATGCRCASSHIMPEKKMAPNDARRAPQTGGASATTPADAQAKVQLMDFTSRRSPVLGSRGMVASSQPLASEVIFACMPWIMHSAKLTAFTVTTPGHHDQSLSTTIMRLLLVASSLR